MAKDLMSYDRMVEAGLRSVVREALTRIAADGLPGGHHFYIAYRTDAEGVEMPDYLRARHPEEITIVLQYQFYGLEVLEDRFSVTLSFNNVPERLVVPFAAITLFADPSVNFALRFQATENMLAASGGGAGAGNAALRENAKAADSARAEPTLLDKGAGRTRDDKPAEAVEKVVSLDQFRRK
jgi:hypothetical protein